MCRCRSRVACNCPSCSCTGDHKQALLLRGVWVRARLLSAPSTSCLTPHKVPRGQLEVSLTLHHASRG